MYKPSVSKYALAVPVAVLIIILYAISLYAILPDFVHRPKDTDIAPAGVHRVIFACEEYDGRYDCTPIGQLDDPKARAYK